MDKKEAAIIATRCRQIRRLHKKIMRIQHEWAESLWLEMYPDGADDLDIKYMARDDEYCKALIAYGKWILENYEERENEYLEG